MTDELAGLVLQALSGLVEHDYAVRVECYADSVEVTVYSAASDRLVAMFFLREKPWTRVTVREQCATRIEFLRGDR
jgi:hypothetical protein